MNLLSLSKYITFNYYGHPVDHCTVSLMADPDLLSPDQIEICKDNLRRRLDAVPVECFPVAGTHATLMPQYFERHPETMSNFPEAEGV